jgi:hypothetical protein
MMVRREKAFLATSGASRLIRDIRRHCHEDSPNINQGDDPGQQAMLRSPALLLIDL